MFFPLDALTRRVAEFGDKNYLGACTQGVFSHKVRKAQSAKAYKGVFYVFVSKTTWEFSYLIKNGAKILLFFETCKGKKRNPHF